MAYKVQFETTDKKISELPLVQIGTKRMVEMEDGRLADFDDPFNYTKYGLEKWVKTIEISDPLPEPFNPLRAEAIKELRVALSRYPGDDYQALLNRNSKMKNAIDRDFPGISLEKIQEWTALVESETERIKEACKRAIPPPEFSSFHLTRKFTGKHFGDLYIENLFQDATPQNNYEGIHWCRCAVCEPQKSVPNPPRTVKTRTLLEMEVIFRPLYSCEKPCRK